MTIEIVYDLEREDDGESFRLLIEGSYDPGEPEEKWGYYGASPGVPGDTEIDSIWLMIPGDAWFYKNKHYDLIAWDGKLTSREEEFIREELYKEANENPL